jgi:hypothetical protein
MAQLAERLHRKQQVVGLIPTLGSTHVLALVAERLKALDCKSGERKLHVSSNLTECSNLILDVAQPGRSASFGTKRPRVRIAPSRPTPKAA